MPLGKPLRVRSLPITVVASDTVTTTGGVFQTQLTIPAGGLKVGDRIKVRLQGIWSTKAIGAGNFTFTWKWGSTTLCASGAAAPTAALTNRGWYCDLFLTIESIGAAGSAMPGGVFFPGGSATNQATFDMPATAAIGSLDTTAAAVITLTVLMAINDATSTMTCQQALAELWRS